MSDEHHIGICNRDFCDPAHTGKGRSPRRYRDRSAFAEPSLAASSRANGYGPVSKRGRSVQCMNARSTDGAWSVRPSCWPCSAGEWASTARRSSCMPSARRAVGRWPRLHRRHRPLSGRRAGRRQSAAAPPAFRAAAVTKAGASRSRSASSAGRARRRPGSCSSRRCSAGPAGAA